MRILVLSNEVWNDKINGNNVTSNWFEGMPVEIANIYGSPGEPYNQCCIKYFQITDVMMAKSILTGTKAGKKVAHSADRESDDIAEREPERLYRFLKTVSGSFMRLVRELIWLWGKYDVSGLKMFIDEFQPDIVFTERMASVKMLRMERVVSQICDAPMVAFTGDDEYSLRQCNFSLFFWINRLMVRKMLKEMVGEYRIYYTLSDEQRYDYEKRFGCHTKILRKCGTFEGGFTERRVHSPIKLIYAGKLYCGRWKVLSEIVEALSEINRNKIKAILEIYTPDRVKKAQKTALHDGKNSFIKGAVSQEELKRRYYDSDIALHVESQDIVYRLSTRLSFSTKIIDCIFSGCAVLAYCWNGQSGWRYLKRENAAICVSDKNGMRKALNQIVENTHIIQKYQKQAYICGLRNHDKERIQSELMDDFARIIAMNIAGR